ncbi:MAG: RNA polymerase sigma factor [Bacteroidetes bacterium]|nr:MAG: RNA polymerase sigma factor [Bacteroidota bacterium]
MNKGSNYTDNELLKLITEDEKSFRFAFDEIYSRYSKLVYSYCQGILKNRFIAEDVFQEVFIGFFSKVRNESDIESIPAFLISIARNLCLKQIRDRKINIPIDKNYLIVDERNQAEKNNLFELIQKALSLLDLKYKEVFILREFDGLSFEEISKICNITQEGVRTRLFRAHNALREILEPYINDLEPEKKIKE